MNKLEKKYYAVILAGGTGSRFGGEMPKQFIDLGGKPIIVHTIEKFLCFSEFIEILICVPEAWCSYTEDLIAKAKLLLPHVKVISGGSERNLTILNSIEYIANKQEDLTKVVVVTHDAVRPFISYDIIKNNIIHARDNPVVDTVVPATDTIVHSVDGEYIDSVPKRSELYQGQTPQSFNAALFKEYISVNKNLELSDAVGLFTHNGQKAKIVMGDYSNIKVTTKFDLVVAKALVNQVSH